MAELPKTSGGLGVRLPPQPTGYPKGDPCGQLTGSSTDLGAQNT